MESISDHEIQNLKRIEKIIHEKHLKAMVWFIIVPILLGLIPRQWIPSRRMRGEGMVFEEIGFLSFFIALLIINIIIQILCSR